VSARPLVRVSAARRAGRPRRVRATLAAPLLALSTGACFATRADVQLLQSDIVAMRAEQLQRDSARGVQLDRVMATLGAVGDSLRATGGRLTQFQGDVRGELFSLGQQLIQIQELTGQSQRRLQELRAGLEERLQSGPPAPTGSPPATGTTPPPPAPAAGATVAPPAGAGVSPGPGPNQLYQLSLDQLRRGSAVAARSGFQDLLRQYPTSDLAPDAQFYIAESLASTGNSAAADSVYQIVVQRYPGSQRASTALYKHALLLVQAGRSTEARIALQQVVSRYPRSDEAELARERLRTLR